jgi:hypothetical protein
LERSRRRQDYYSQIAKIEQVQDRDMFFGLIKSYEIDELKGRV